MTTDPKEKKPFFSRVWRFIIGPPRDLLDHSLFKKMSLIPLLAWIGLGADGLSSSTYGPSVAYLFLADNNSSYLVIFLVGIIVFTIFTLSSAYSNIIENFPRGGGGYIVASRTVNKYAGLVAGSTLVIDYVLTIAVSLTAATDAIFNFIPADFHNYKIGVAIFLIILLVLLNLRGVKESVIFLAPIFVLFLLTHIILISLGIGFKGDQIISLAHEFPNNLRADISAIGYFGIFAIIIRAFSLGSGTFTGLEAVSNGIPIMRQPQTKSGKRTMLYMALSLALVSSGLLFCYYLWQLEFQEGLTLNAILANSVFGDTKFAIFVIVITLLSEAFLLIVASQAGFIDGPRVMANMARDGWLPKRLSTFSERLVTDRGIILMGGSAIIITIIANFFSPGDALTTLIIMYAINVFLNFVLAELGMVRLTFRNLRKKIKLKLIRYFLVHLIGFALSAAVFIAMLIEKFTHGGWITILITSIFIVICFIIRRQYDDKDKQLKEFDKTLENISFKETKNASVDEYPPINPAKPIAVILVNGYNGFGVYTFFSIINDLFPYRYEDFIFVSIAVLNTGNYKDSEELQTIQDNTSNDLQKYVDLARGLRFNAEYRTDVGIDVVGTAVPLLEEIKEKYPNATIYAGQRIFAKWNIFQRMLFNRTAFDIQWHLHMKGITTIILPIPIEAQEFRSIDKSDKRYGSSTFFFKKRPKF